MIYKKILMIVLALGMSILAVLDINLSSAIVAHAVNVLEFSVAANGETYLSANFQVKEFACKDGTDTVYIDLDLVSSLQKIRDHFQSPVIISSGYRSPAHNANTPGAAKNSYHVKGQAADIYINGVSPLDVAKYAESLGMNGIGLYESFTHVDTRSSDNKFYWKTSDQIPVSSFGGNPPSNPDTESDMTDSLLNGLDKVLNTGLMRLPEGMILSYGDQNEYVGSLQRALISLGYDLSPYGDDNWYGDLTIAAVKKIQAKYGLAQDGLYGPLTQEALLQELNAHFEHTTDMTDSILKGVEAVATVTTTSLSSASTTTSVTTTTTSRIPMVLPSELHLESGEQYQLNTDKRDLIFRSSDPDAVIISSSGIITAICREATVFIIDNNNVNSIKVKVKTPVQQNYGDLNVDGMVNVSDAVLIARMIAEDSTVTITEQGLRNADINGDGVISPDDSTALLKKIAGM